METKPVTDLLDELDGSMEEFLNVSEGLRHDLEQKDLMPETVLEVQALLNEYDITGRMFAELHHYMSDGLGVITQLLNRGYPELPSREFPAAAYDDLNQNRETIEAAQKQMIRKQEAQGGEVVIEDIVPADFGQL